MHKLHSRLLRLLSGLMAVLVLLVTFALIGAVPQIQALTASGASLPWSVLGAGGGNATSSSYSLYATLGQPLSGASSSSSVRLSTGFWQAGAGQPETPTYRVYLPSAIRTTR